METKNKVIIDLEVDGGDSINKVNENFKNVGKTSKKVSDDIKKDIKAPVADVNKLSDGVAGLKDNLSVSSIASKGFGGTIKAVTSGMWGLVKSAWAFITTPVGAVIAAISVVAGILYSIFKGFTPVLDKIEQGMAAISAVMNVVKNAFIGLITGSKSFKESIGSLGGSMRDAAVEAAKLTKAQQDLDDAFEQNEINAKKVGNQIDKLMVQSKNRSISEEERMGLIDQAMALEKQQYEQTKKLNDEQYNLELNKLTNITAEELKDIKERGVAALRKLQDDKFLSDDEVEIFKNLELQKLDIENKGIQFQEKAQNQLDKLADTAAAKEEKRIADAAKASENAAKTKQDNIDKQLKASEDQYKQEIIDLKNKNIEAGKSTDELNKILEDKELEHLQKTIKLRKKLGLDTTDLEEDLVNKRQENIDKTKQDEKSRVDFLKKLNDEELEDKATTEEEKALLAEKYRHDERIAEIEALGFKLTDAKKYNELIEAENQRHSKTNEKISTDSAADTAKKVEEILLGFQEQTAEEIAIKQAENDYDKAVASIKALKLDKEKEDDYIVTAVIATNKKINKIKADAAEEEAEKTEKERKEKLNKDLGDAQEIADGVLNIANQAIEFQKNIETEAQNKKYVQRLNDINNLKISEAEKNKLKEKAEKDNAKALAKIEEKAAKQKDKTAKAEALVNAALAIVKTWAGYANTGPAAPILAGLQTAIIVATAATQISAIDKAAAERQGGSYANGGIIPGSSYTGDKLNANVNSGEMILNQEQQAKLFNQVNSGDGGNNINAEIIAQAVIKAIQSIPVVITEQAITEKQKEVKIRESRFSY